jgi:polysaccharide pyruvyl transferase WcaK-like protein
VSVELAKEFPGAIVAPRFKTPQEAKSYISGLDFFAGARMHACIAAFSSGVPVLPMAYSRKFSGLFGSLGYELVADCRTLGASEMQEAFRQAFQDRVRLKALVADCLSRGLERLRLYEDAVAKELASLRLSAPRR